MNSYSYFVADNIIWICIANPSMKTKYIHNIKNTTVIKDNK